MLQLFRKHAAAVDRPVLVLVTRDLTTYESLEFYLGQQREPAYQVKQHEPESAGSQLEQTKSAAVLVFELDSAEESELAALQRVMERRPADLPVIVISPDVDEAMVRLFLRLRVADWLPKPADPSALIDACRRVELTTAGVAGPQANCLTFLGALGGVGTTSLALHAALLLSQRKIKDKAKNYTCLVDLDFVSGMCTEYVDLAPGLQLEEIAPNPSRLDDHLLGVMLSQYSPTLSVLAARTKFGQFSSLDPLVVAKMLDLVANRFANIVVDLPRAWCPWTETVLLGSTVCYVVTELTVPGLRSAGRIVSEISERTNDEVTPRVIINKHRKKLFGTGITHKEVTKVLNDGFAGYVRSEPSLVREAIDRGVPITELKGRSGVVKDLGKIILAAG